jgi:hypothetical protein
VSVTAATSSSSSYNSILSLLNNAASPAPANADATSAKTAAADSSSSSGGPVDSVHLSDQAKATLARAKTDQVAADKLASFVQSLRNQKHPSQTSSGKTPSSSSQTPVTFEELAGISQTSVTATRSTTNSNNAPPSGGDQAAADWANYRYEPKVTFSDTLQFNGFSISASANANSWNSDVQISGPDGLKAWNTIWGGGKDAPTAGGGGGTNNASTTFSSQIIDNKLIVTFISASAAVSETATHDASGSAAQSTAASQSSITNIVIDFETGKISATEAESSVAATSIGIQKA